VVQDPSTLLAVTSCAVAGLGLASAAALKGWGGWLELKRLELSGRGTLPSSARRTALAELRERVRRLEAIASGSEL
jgi:hypothetical protein